MNVYRFLSRSLGGFFVLLVFAILIGETINEGIPAQFPFTAVEILLFLCLLTSLVGLILGWRQEILGGWLTIAGMVLFTLVNSLTSGYFRFNWVFAGIALSGALFLLSARQAAKPEA